MATLTSSHRAPRTRPRLKGRAAAVLLALAFLATGCTNPFAPAKPPATSGGGVIEDYSSPAKLIATLEDAIAAKGDGASAYINAFADSTGPGDLYGFHAFHDQAVINTYNKTPGHTAPPNWDKTLERQFFSSFMGSVDPTFPFALTLDTVDGSQPNEVIDTGAGTALLHRLYTVVASTSNYQENVIIGRCDLYLYKNNGRWYIYRWQDRLDPAIGETPVNSSELSWGRRRLDSLTR